MNEADYRQAERSRAMGGAWLQALSLAAGIYFGLYLKVVLMIAVSVLAAGAMGYLWTRRDKFGQHWDMVFAKMGACVFLLLCMWTAFSITVVPAGKISLSPGVRAFLHQYFIR